MNELKKEQIKAIVLSSICIVLGLLFCVLPNKMLSTVETVISIAFIIYGIINILIYCLMNSDIRENKRLVKGAVATAFALLLIFVKSLFVICLGLLVVFSGIIYILSALKEKNGGDKKWWLALAIGIVFAVLGLTVAVLCNTKLAKNIVMTIFGLTLIADGLVRLIYIFVARKMLYVILSKKQKSDVIEPEFEIKNDETSKKEKVQKNNENGKKAIKNQQKIKENAKNAEDNIGMPDENQDEDDDGVEGFI